MGGVRWRCRKLFTCLGYVSASSLLLTLVGFYQTMFVGMRHDNLLVAPVSSDSRHHGALTTSGESGRKNQNATSGNPHNKRKHSAAEQAGLTQKDELFFPPQNWTDFSPEDALRAALLVTQKSSSTLYATRRQSLTSRIARFKSMMTSDEKALLLDTAKRLAHITTEWDIPCFLYGGALLGSYRHHDVIPWDDDLDVLVSVSQRYQLFRAINASPNYDVFLAGPRMKMFSLHSRQMTRYPWGWPYLDISFYAENDTHIWDTADEYKDFIYPKSLVFPLHKRPLGDFFFSAPRDSYANLRLTYKDSLDCATHHYSHKYEKAYKGRRKTSIPCDLLKDSVPFVHRSVSGGGGLVETLMLGEAVIHSLVVDEPRYAISKPYSLELQLQMN